MKVFKKFGYMLHVFVKIKIVIDYNIRGTEHTGENNESQ